MVWQGGFYVRDPDDVQWILRLQVQAHDQTNTLSINDHFVGYLPTKDWTYTWVTAEIPVPPGLLREGYNSVRIESGMVEPHTFSPVSFWDDIVVRDIILVPCSRIQ